MTCIYSTLMFVQDQASKLGIPTPAIPFDQLLWLKATEIINAKSLQMVAILGGFHLLMSYLGSLGTLMKGSGLSQSLEESCGSNAVKHVLSGKAIARAIRCHLLVSSALTTKLLRHIIPSDEEQVHDSVSKINESEMKEIEAVLNKINSDPSLVNECLKESSAICILDERLNDVINDLSKQSRTAKYWCQYL